MTRAPPETTKGDLFVDYYLSIESWYGHDTFSLVDEVLGGTPSTMSMLEIMLS